jgi:hypothetical protein
MATGWRMSSAPAGEAAIESSFNAPLGLLHGGLGLQMLDRSNQKQLKQEFRRCEVVSIR